MDTVFAILSNPAVSAIVGIGLTALITLLCRKYGWFAAIQPLALQALKAVEAAIPDGTTVSSAHRIDQALKVYLAVRESAGKTVSDAEQAKAAAIIAEAVNSK